MINLNKKNNNFQQNFKFEGTKDIFSNLFGIQMSKRML